MDKHKAALAIVEHMLPHVAFEGWSQAALAHGAAEAGFSESDAVRVFPRGALSALEAFVSHADEAMIAHYRALDAVPERIRDRIAALIRLRLMAYSDHREAVRRGLAVYALPVNAALGLRALARTSDAMWHAAGDSATDWNWYSKRALLAGVYVSTLIFWLNDESEGSQATWEFLDRRISNVMGIEKAKQRLRHVLRRA